MYALDTEHTVRYLSPSDVTSLGIPASQLRNKAIKNLKSLLPKVTCRGEDGRFMLTAGGTYESSLLLFDSLWTKERFPVKGDIVVAIPARDVLLVTGSEDADGIAGIQTACRQVAEANSYRLTNTLFIRKDGGWIPYKE